MNHLQPLFSLIKWVVEEVNKNFYELRRLITSKLGKARKSSKKSPWHPKYFFGQHRLKKILKNVVFLSNFSEQTFYIWNDLQDLIHDDDMVNYLDLEKRKAAAFYFVCDRDIQRLLVDLYATEPQFEKIWRCLKYGGVALAGLGFSGSSINISKLTVGDWRAAAVGGLGLTIAIVASLLEEEEVSTRPPFLQKYNPIIDTFKPPMEGPLPFNIV